MTNPKTEKLASTINLLRIKRRRVDIENIVETLIYLLEGSSVKDHQMPEVARRLVRDHLVFDERIKSRCRHEFDKA